MTPDGCRHTMSAKPSPLKSARETIGKFGRSAKFTPVCVTPAVTAMGVPFCTEQGTHGIRSYNSSMRPWLPALLVRAKYDPVGSPVVEYAPVGPVKVFATNVPALVYTFTMAPLTPEPVDALVTVPVREPPGVRAKFTMTNRLAITVIGAPVVTGQGTHGMSLYISSMRPSVLAVRAKYCESCDSAGVV